MRLFASGALLGLLFVTFIDSSECLQTAVVPNKGLTVTVSTVLPLDQCAVCTISGVNDTQTSCNSSLTLVPEEEVKLLFNCSQPIEQAYTVTIAQTIECTKDACNPTMLEAQTSILPELSRTFTWELKAPEKTLVGLDILRQGLMETSQPCTDGFQYLVVISKTNTKGRTQYCPGGSETSLDAPNGAVVSLQVKPKALVESLFQASAAPRKGRTMVVSVDSRTTVVVSRDPEEPECEVCSVVGSTRDCSPTEKTLTNVEKLSLEFSCLKPQDVYRVTMKKKIECTQSSCTPAAGEVNPDIFKDFQRSLTWDISLPERTVLTLDFPGGLKEMSGAEKCQDGQQYSVSTTNSEGKVKTNSYCEGGTVSLHLLGATTVTAEVPTGSEVDSFTVKAAPRGGRMMSVMPDPGTIVIISRLPGEPDCEVCIDKEPNQKCKSTHLRLEDPHNTTVEFTCPQPQDVFIVEINREIDCKDISCSGNVVQAESLLFPDFNRTFTWDVTVVSTRVFQLDFPEPGMRQIPNQETCPDEHTYSIITYLRAGLTTIGTFCKGGPVTTILPRRKGRMSLQVPGDRKLDPVDFKLSVGPVSDMVAILKVNLPRGMSDTDLITANYPSDFPDNQQMQWDFTVPGMYNYTIQFRDHTAPECLNKIVEVEYQKETKKVTKLTLTDSQPQHEQGNFKMVLRNCETNTTLQGLTLNYRVSVMRSGHPVLCAVNLTERQGVSLQIEKVGSDPYCEMSVNSKVENKINVAAGTKASLSFLDCPNEDVRLTASKAIECKDETSCSATQLTVPKLDSCLPMPLHSFTWHLKIPQDRTVDLVSPKGSLRQSLPGQECNESVSLRVAEGDGFSVGDFCYNGILQKVQVHGNVSVTATVPDFSKTMEPFLNVSFSQEIPETIIYRVSPDVSSPFLLASPNWPLGMRSSATVSWIVNVPSQHVAHMQFVNLSQPKCSDSHTSIKVKMLGDEEEIMSRREDEKAEDTLMVPRSFYLNMSNCKPEEGHFGAVTKIVLQKKSNLLAILLGLAGALLLLLTVLAIVCFVTKKKKKDKLAEESSIYIGKGNIFRPSDRHFTKTRADNDSHVYASIDEAIMYGHLLGDSSYADSMQDHFNGVQVDSYNTFTGPTDPGLPVIKEPDHEPELERFKTFLDPSESFIPSRPRTPIDRQDSLGFQDRRMLDNELYTFKSTGDINPIRLSGVDMDPQPPTILEDSL
ncbi:CUB domain-containing protein 1 [Anoplopoma fimbria]|uniref:CUB domain-containing protein 1 n=1 Tax=Anoplopoma fimbria TaxID=229290 RepID=UPI0023EC2214|nr:CUB domain-containing protein 1 [Anoplopoma fimbria]XP_054461969.1 CUB domain-containing protein 1 [Anoplopoma fimbria]